VRGSSACCVCRPDQLKLAPPGRPWATCVRRRTGHHHRGLQLRHGPHQRDRQRPALHTGTHYGPHRHTSDSPIRPQLKLGLLLTQVQADGNGSLVTCVLPPGAGRDVLVTISNPRYPQLSHGVNYLSYQVLTSSQCSAAFNIPLDSSKWALRCWIRWSPPPPQPVSQVAPPPPLQPVIANLGACSVDLTW
jgi:hypothetical protein